MAKANKHHMSPDGQGKGTGTGGMTNANADQIGDNMILSNRDKSRHTEARGLDSKAVQADQSQGRETDNDRDPTA